MDSNFILLKKRPWKIEEDVSAKDCLIKWSLKESLTLSRWAFNQPYQPHNAKKFVIDFLRSCQQQLGISTCLDLDKASVEPVPCSVTSLDFFNRIGDPGNGIVHHGEKRDIRGCFEETVGGFQVADELHQMLLNEESSKFLLYTDGERRELLFRIFLHVALGGHCCQYEDNLDPYVDVTVMLYKDLLSVQRNANRKEVEIRSKCFRVLGGAECNVQDFVYVIVDPDLREVILFANKY